LADIVSLLAAAGCFGWVATETMNIRATETAQDYLEKILKEHPAEE
jgi:hypothetical protein